MSKNKKDLYFGTAILFVIFVIIYVFSLFYEPIGDDILTYFDRGITLYLDNVESTLGHRFCSIRQVINSTAYIYKVWSGRFVGYFFNFIGTLLPKFLLAFFKSLILFLNVFFTVRIVKKDTISVLKTPIYCLLLFMSACWYKYGTFFTYTWTDITIYSLPIMLCLLYYNLEIVDTDKKHSLFIITIIGFLAGAAHEVISMQLIVMVGINYIKSFIKKEKTFKSIFRNTGLIIGYAAGFFAPGNFSRIHESHDYIDTSLFYRIYKSAGMHKALLVNTKGSLIIFSLTFALFVFYFYKLCKNDNNYFIRFIWDNLDLLANGIISILVWSIFHHVAPYHIDFWVFTVYAVMFKTIENGINLLSYHEIEKFCSLLSFMVLLTFILINKNELASFISTSIERTKIINFSQENGLSEATIPAYDEKLSNERYSLDYLNNESGDFDSIYYREYYKLKITVE